MAMLYPVWSNPVSAGEDDVVFYYPLRKMVGQALREGRLPLYYSHEATGMPLMADPQSAVMYPPTWLFALMDAKRAYSLSIFLAFSLAGGGMFLYLRRLGLVRPAATFAAVAFMFSGFMVGHRVHLAMIHTACYLPWGLWCVEVIGRRPLAGLLCMAPIAFLTVAAGHWPTLVGVAGIWMIYVFVRGRPLFRTLGVAAAAMLIAALLTAPQIAQTAQLLASTTRHHVGYAMAGENSFFPAAGVLAVFPMLMGSRTPNFYSQQWWGPWHLCEMLGYVGLLTLVLAVAAVLRLYRKSSASAAKDLLPARQRSQAEGLQGLLRKWTWIAIAASVLMLGYYLPSYRLIHMLPLVGLLRCPARLLLVVDLALATLAGIAIHSLVTARAPSERLARLKKTIRRGATIVLPIVMLAVVAVVWIVGLLLSGMWPDKMPFFAGGAEDMLAAVRVANPAVWVPLALVIASGLVVRFWLGQPGRRAGALIVMLLVDLFFITRFVDVPASGSVMPDPEESPAATWLRKNAGTDAPYRIWGLSETYHHRPAELLLPKTCWSLGFSSIASYGPFHSPAHAQLLGFRIFGTTRDWPRLLRGNYLLSLYRVRYILAANPKFRRVIESVRIPLGPPGDQGPNRLTGSWDLRRVEVDRERLRLSTPFLWSRSVASQPVRLLPGGVYRIALDARGPEGAAANFLRAEIFRGPSKEAHLRHGPLGLTVFAEQIGPDWRHFEWTFRAPQELPDKLVFRLYTMSERPIEVRRLSLRASHWEQPVLLGKKLSPGQAIYRLLAELPARRRGDPPVAIYENLLCRGPSKCDSSSLPAGRVSADGRPRQPDNESIERLKWRVSEQGSQAGGYLDVPSLAAELRRPPGAQEIVVMALGALAYGLLVVVAVRRKMLAKCDKKFT